MATRTVTLKIDIISDTICPWCFIGKRRLEKAMAQFKSTHPDVRFDLEWHPYQLNPNFTSVKPKLEHYQSKFGEERANFMIQNTKSVGASEGIHISYGGVMVNTLASHRLISWSRQFGKQTEVVEEVFKDYFEREQNIADYQVLAAAAERAGLDKEKALAYLNSNEGIDAIREEVEKNQLASQGGVPNYKIDKRFGLLGAQDPSAFLSLFEKAWKSHQDSL